MISDRIICIVRIKMLIEKKHSMIFLSSHLSTQYVCMASRNLAIIISCKDNQRILTFSVVAVAMFKALLRAPIEADGAKAAAEPTRREAMASFMV